MEQRHHQCHHNLQENKAPVTEPQHTLHQLSIKKQEKTQDVNSNPPQFNGINLDDQKNTNQPETQSETQVKQDQKLYCHNRLTRIQCLFLIIGIISFTVGSILLGVLLGRSWVNNSVKAKATPVYTVKFVTSTGNHINTLKLMINQSNLLKQNTQDTFYVTKSQKPTTEERNLQDSTNAVQAFNPPAFVSLTEGAITAKAANSEDISLLINFQELPTELKLTDSTRLLEQTDLNQIIEGIKEKIALQAEVDPSQVSVTQQVYVKLIPSQNGKLTVEEVKVSRLLPQDKNEQKPAKSGQVQKATAPEKNKSSQKTNTDKKDTSNNTKLVKQDTKENNIAKQTQNKETGLRSKAAAHIAKFFRNVRQKFRRHGKTIEKQSKTEFKETNDILVASEQQKKIGKNHIQITRVYKDGLHRKPKQIKNTHVIPEKEFEGIKHCYQGKDGKYCQLQFINREDNPFQVINQSLKNPQKHRRYKIIKVVIYDKSSKKLDGNKKHESHNHPLRNTNSKQQSDSASVKKPQVPDKNYKKVNEKNNSKKQEPKPAKVQQNNSKKQEPKTVKVDSSSEEPKKQQLKPVEPKKSDEKASSKQSEGKSSSNIVEGKNEAAVVSEVKGNN